MQRTVLSRFSSHRAGVGAAACVLLAPFHPTQVARAFGLDYNDLREKLLVERKKKKLQQAANEKLQARRSAPGTGLNPDGYGNGGAIDEDDGQCGDEVDEEELLREVRDSDTVAGTDELRQQKRDLGRIVMEQRERRMAKKQAFLDWQAGQREKGSAGQILRKTQKAERYKRVRCDHKDMRLLSVALRTETGTNTNNNFDEGLLESFSRPHQGATDFMDTGADFVNSASAGKKKGETIWVSLGRP